MKQWMQSLGWFSLGLPLSGMAVLWFLSSLPGEPHSSALLFYGVSINMTPQLQNLIHIPAFFVLGCLWLFSFDILRIPQMQATMGTMVLGIGFGIVDEWHQSFVPYRYPGLLDVFLDALGVITACALWPRVRGLLLPAEEPKFSKR